MYFNGNLRFLSLQEFKKQHYESKNYFRSRGQNGACSNYAVTKK
jgi:hypothetical protein